ncbi:MAG: hypothetical protein ACR2QS_12625 [Woeseiaceae bacterium]
MKARPRLLYQLVVATMFLVASVGHVYAQDFPGGKLDRRIIKTQQKVDSLFEKGDYDRAYFIYRQELVPLGDKYAQYMVGYMTIVGKGTERDVIAGSAWYRLAAERGDKNFSKARDEILGYFSGEQLISSDQAYSELRLEFSDAIIIATLIEEDLGVLSDRASNSSLAYSPTDTSTVDEEELARRAEQSMKRIQTRLTYLDYMIASGVITSAEERARIDAVAQRARGVLE